MKEKDLSGVPLEDLILIQQGKFDKLSVAGAEAYNNAPEVDDAPAAKGSLEEKKDALKARGWENLSPGERLALMAMSAPGKMVEETLGVKDIKNAAAGIIMRAAPVAIGQKLGELTRIPAAANVLGGIGGVVGEVAADLYEGQKPTAGNLLTAFGSGAVRGRHVNSVGATAKEAGRQGAINVGLDEVQSVVDEGELKAPSAAAFGTGAASVGAQRLMDTGKTAQKTAIKKADESRAYETIEKAGAPIAGTDLGRYPVFPREAVPTQFERATNARVRADIGLSPTTKLTEAAYAVHINKLTEPHRLAAKLSPEANLALTGMQDARNEARKVYAQFRASQGMRPDLQDEADRLMELANSFETGLINETRKLGKHALAENIIENRPLLSKTYLARKATNLSRGVADAKTYGDELKKSPGKLTGEAKIIGDTYNANQEKEFQMKNMLSRPVTIAQTVQSAVEHTETAQKFSRNKPSWHQYPDLSADAARFVTAREGRKDAPKEIRSAPTVTERVKKYLFGP